MTTIKDSVHDHIEVRGVAAALLDTPPVQRLRRVHQLGTASLVYPAANHTRFEHSLGVYHLAREALDSLDVDGARAKRVRAAAILHDAGHGPFSHAIEDLIHDRTGKYHDDVDDLLGSGDVARVLDEHGLDPARVAAMVRGEGDLAGIVAGELDVDRMDYLVRDAHHTGVPYGTIDHGRLVRALTRHDGALVLDEGNVQSAESLLLARALMNPTVYNHHVARISTAMLRRAAERLLATTETTPETLRRMDDPALRTALRDRDASAAFARRLDRRDLYKRAVWAEMADVADDPFADDPVLDADGGEVRGYEREIAARAGVDRDAVLLDVRERPTMRESDSRVLVNGEVRRLDEQSTLVRALQMAQREQWRLGVYAPPDEVDAVGRAAVDVLGLDIDGALVNETTRGQYNLGDFGEN
ncbi:HD domain-containing protein [Halarchaeum nitratireducens]|uniref:Phosphohydrolase n=1 Tax=Halarchaeum nitratireducens TaxID=489913 RepID=A0A830GB59_9EURY|nr:HD domain-containing protein [Halarchaeum nitratireducens]MBP2250526.1 HD superfamily phosphohydrolase [Halarchaeum solikamskense]GGN15069.1 phosphohydrolase [Halarchaeum nitratireducens]